MGKSWEGGDVTSWPSLLDDGFLFLVVGGTKGAELHRTQYTDEKRLASMCDMSSCEMREMLVVLWEPYRSVKFSLIECLELPVGFKLAVENGSSAVNDEFRVWEDGGDTETGVGLWFDNVCPRVSDSYAVCNFLARASRSCQNW